MSKIVEVKKDKRINKIVNISDVIKLDKSDLTKNDISWNHLTQWIKEISNYFEVDINFNTNITSVNLIWSTFWNSYETWLQATEYLNNITPNIGTQVLLVNNANRWWFSNDIESKWSSCLFAVIKINNIIQYVTWVDNTVFSVLKDFYKEDFLEIFKIKWVRQINWFKDFKWVEDLSKWTQFRSKEHFPLVQILTYKLLNKLNNKTTLIKENLQEYFYTEDYELKYNITKIKEFFKNYNKDPEYIKNYLDDKYIWIELVKLIWDAEFIEDKLWFKAKWYELDLLDKYEDQKELYSEIVNNLQINQALVLDIDKFENVVLAPSVNIKNISHFVEKNNLQLWDKLTVSSVEDWKIWEFIINNSICWDTIESQYIWNSSSNLPGWRKALNIWVFKAWAWDRFDKLSKFRIWDIIEFKKIQK